ncbi:MAG: DUF4358 domain-containing protein [Oscillospiraceae bacterium]|nr:DUF4358 domain-containing protein [Oscillospiraceae bacterium]
MKKFALIALTLALAAVMTACSGNSSSSSSAPESSTPSSQSSESSSEPSSEESSSAPEAGQGVTPEDFVNEVAGTIPDLALEPISEQVLTEMYHVNMDDVEEYYGVMSLINVQAYDFVAVKAKEGRVDAVKEALETRRQDRIDEFARYPVNNNDVNTQNAQVITKGNYVVLLISDDYDTPTGILENYFND